MWEINLGKNIREGAHYTQFMVYDFDGDGKAELAMKTADGSIDAKGNVIGDSTKDYRNDKGYILSGPEYLTMFDGLTGAALSTIDFTPPRHGKLNPTTDELKEMWGDGYGNRMDRFLGAVAYLDGNSLIRPAANRQYWCLNQKKLRRYGPLVMSQAVQNQVPGLGQS